MKTRGEKEEKKRKKASEETAGTVEGETHTHNGWYLKYNNNNWKGERAERHDGAKKCRYTVPTGNIVERRKGVKQEHRRWLQTN